MQRLAVCDLGSNSFRMVVFVASDEGWWRRVDEVYEPVRISEGMTETGALQTAPMRRAQDFLEVFSHFGKAAGMGKKEVDAVATSAIREATNADAFLREARKRTGLQIRVLSREEEARYGYLAAVNSTSLADGCVLDLGGGSMQLVQVRGRLATQSESWRLGAVRMTERFLDDGGKASKKQLDKLRGHVRHKLARAPWVPRSGQRLVGIGGTVRNLATAAQKAAGLPDVGVQGQVVTPGVLADIVDELASLPASERAKVPGIKPSRADLILAGAVVVQCVLEVGGFADGIEATEAGLREGVFFEHHLGAGGRDPLWDDVRRASVENLAAQYPTDREHTAHVRHKLARAPWVPRSGQRLVGIGGTVRNLATAAQKAAGLPDVGVQGQVVTPGVLADIVDELASLPASERAKVPGIKPSRADLILAGAVVVQCVLEVGGFADGIEATEAGLREGVFFEHHLGAGGRDPLWDDVRRASVENLAAQYPTDREHTAHVAKLALALFDELGAAGLHPCDPIERELLWAASLLHDVGMTIDYDDHHKHSKYLVLNAGLPGFSPREVALVAQAVRYHRKGLPTFGDLAPLFDHKHDDRRLDRLSVLLRLAEDLERSRDQAVRSTSASAVNGEVRLTLEADPALVTVPRWAASRETELFGRAFGKTLVVR